MPKSLSELVSLVIDIRTQWGFGGTLDRYRIRVECARQWASLAKVATE